MCACVCTCARACMCVCTCVCFRCCVIYDQWKESYLFPLQIAAVRLWLFKKRPFIWNDLVTTVENIQHCAKLLKCFINVRYKYNSNHLLEDWEFCYFDCNKCMR